MLLTLLVLFNSAQAQELPPSMVKLQEAMVQDHSCEADWPTLVAENGIKRIPIDGYTTLIAVPCARWSLNLSYRVFAEFNEQPKLYARVNFANLDPDGAIVARDEIYNDWEWNEGTFDLTSIYRFDASLDCGSKTVYRWDTGKLRFALKSVYLKTACDRAPTAWPEVPLVGAPGARARATVAR